MPRPVCVDEVKGVVTRARGCLRGRIRVSRPKSEVFTVSGVITPAGRGWELQRPCSSERTLKNLQAAAHVGGQLAGGGTFVEKFRGRGR